MRKQVKQQWTDSENALLAEYFHTLSMDALLAVFTGRSYAEISKQAAELKKRNVEFKQRY